MNAQTGSLFEDPGFRAMAAPPPVCYRIVVYGSPAPQGSKKFVGTFTGRDGRTHAKLIESSKAVRPWREDVKTAALLARNGAPPLDGPLIVRMVFTMPKPSSAPKTRRTYPMRMPDLSKLARSTEDALTGARVTSVGPAAELFCAK